MAIVFDQCSKGSGNSASNFSSSHTIGGGSKRILIVGLVTRCTTICYVNHIRYNGVNMTYLNYVSRNSGSNNLLTQLWFMPEASLPSAGTHNITVDVDRSIDEGWMIFGVSYTGILQQNPLAQYSDSAASATSLSHSLTAKQANSRIIQVCGTSLAQTPATSGSNNLVINDGSVYCQGSQSSMGGMLCRDQPANLGDSDTFGFTVASASRLVYLYCEFLPNDMSVPLTGIRRTSGTGSVKAVFSKALSGSRGTSATGSLLSALSKALSGIRAVFSHGSVTPAVSKELTGEDITSAPGSVSPGQSVALTGEDTASATGSVTPAVSKELTGEDITSAPGSVSPGQSVALTGEDTASATGAVTPEVSKVLTGKKLLVGTGSLQGIKGVILFYNGLMIKHYDPVGTYPGRVKIGSSTYGLNLINATDDHAGCVRMKAAGSVYALELEK